MYIRVSELHHREFGSLDEEALRAVGSLASKLEAVFAPALSSAWPLLQTGLRDLDAPEALCAALASLREVAQALKGELGLAPEMLEALAAVLRRDGLKGHPFRARICAPAVACLGDVLAAQGPGAASVPGVMTLLSEQVAMANFSEGPEAELDAMASQDQRQETPQRPLAMPGSKPRKAPLRDAAPWRAAVLEAALEAYDAIVHVHLEAGKMLLLRDFLSGILDLACQLASATARAKTLRLSVRLAGAMASAFPSELAACSASDSGRAECFGHLASFGLVSPNATVRELAAPLARVVCPNGIGQAASV